MVANQAAQGRDPDEQGPPAHGRDGEGLEAGLGCGGKWAPLDTLGEGVREKKGNDEAQGRARDQQQGFHDQTPSGPSAPARLNAVLS